MTSKEAFYDLIEMDLGKPLRQAGEEEVYNKLNTVAKDLNILEEIRNTFKVEKEETINQNRYWLIVKKKPYYSYMITKEQYDKWKRWLDNE